MTDAIKKEQFNKTAISNPSSNTPKEKKNSFSVHRVINQNMVSYLYGMSERYENVQLILKKRGTAFRYSFPVEWIREQYWSVKIDFRKYNFSNGTWDYYIKNPQQKSQRISVYNHTSFEELAPVYCFATKGSKEIIHYETQNDNLSFVSQKASVHLSELKSKVSDKGTVLMSGVLEGNPIKKYNPHQNKHISIQERNSRLTTQVSCKIEEKDEKCFLTFKVNYLDILIQQYTDQRWDVFLNLEIEGTYHVFQLGLTSDQIESDSRWQFDDEQFHQMFFYQTIKKHLALCFLELPIKRNVEKYELSHKFLFLHGKVYFDAVKLSDKEMVERAVIIKSRKTGKERVIFLDTVKTSDTEFQVDIPVRHIIPKDTNNEIYDLYIELGYKNLTKRCKLGCNQYEYYKDDILAKTQQNKTFQRVSILYYLTYTPAGNLKLETFSLTNRIMRYLKKGQYLDQSKFRDRDIWLIGERPDTAQDTAYHFFKYCRKNHPEKDIYYVIDSTSNDLINVKELGNVLYRGSLEHFRKAAIANVLIGSHDLEYILPINSVELASYKNAKKMFLQHGVLGRKSAEYHKSYYRYPFDIFCVSSTSEKNLVEKKMKYNSDDIKVTGLSRFDKLLEPHTESQTILVIPTWREWLNDEDTFLQSEYFNRYKALLQSERLIKVLDDYDLNIKFYPHYRMQQFINEFGLVNSERVQVVSLGEKSVQELLLESKLMITDYSSVSFDFNYMSKPVIFYHFDQDSFFKNGILRPVEETFLGDICSDRPNVIDQVWYYVQNNFKEKEKISEKKHLIFNRVDQNNCHRVYHTIQGLTSV